MSLRANKAKRLDIAWDQFARACRLYRGNTVLPQHFAAMLFAKMIALGPEMRECLSGEGSDAAVAKLARGSFADIGAMGDSDD